MGQAMMNPPAAISDLSFPRAILVVDDDPEVSQAVACMIEQLGHHAVVCDNAQDALARIPLGKFDMMLIDYRMPELTGIDMVSMLREEDCQIPVVIMPGFPATEERVSLEKLGIAGVLRKPVLAASLARAIDECLGLHRPA